MSVLELARRVYERLKAQRNGHASTTPNSEQTYEVNEVNEVNPPGGWTAPGYDRKANPFDQPDEKT
jgi:hypothetical protein